MLVLKFGGTSVANAENIKKVISIVSKKHESSQKIILVVSALGGITDILLQAASSASMGDLNYKEYLHTIQQRHQVCIQKLLTKENQDKLLNFLEKVMVDMIQLCDGIYMLREVTPRAKDKMASYGEYLSSTIIATAVSEIQLNAEWVDARELITTNSFFGSAQVDFKKTNFNIQSFLKKTSQNIYVVPGFIASDVNGVSTTLGRGGSDYTAAIFAAALMADSLEIWTDVSGMMTADPRLCNHAKIISAISYQEAMELSHFGAKVIYPPTLQPVMNHNIPVWIKNTFSPDDLGTVITMTNSIELTERDHTIVRGISSMNTICLLTLEGSGMVGIPGFSKRLFEALSNEKINVILITQSSSEHAITVGINAGDAEKATSAVNQVFENEISLQIVDPLKVENNLSIVALVGENMRNHTGVSGRMFSAMGRNGINIRAIAQGSSEKNISAVIDMVDVKKTINVLHEEFFETTYKQINLFIAGVGNVGKKLLLQLNQQSEFLRDKMRLQIRLVGIINSKKMLIDESGIQIHSWEEALNAATDSSDIDLFVKRMIQLNFRNSVFVDVTANHEVAATYHSILWKSIAVVACNKVAASSEYNNYKKLKETSREFNAPFLFETNVGAGLPIIGTINDLMHSGDHIHRIEAVLSGTLNFVFNHYDGTQKFAEIVKQAQNEGYTEPDPRLDLGGTDVMRKIMILAREAGETIEMDSIENHIFMPAACMQGTVSDFYTSMEQHEVHFRKLFDDAHSSGNKLKFVATYQAGKAMVGLQHIHPENDLYHLYGKDNVVLFYTDRYKDQPLVVKGAGAGADVTASGVFADILRASKK